MVTATPDTLGDVLREVVAQAQRQAAAQPEKFAQFLHKLGDDAGQAADEVRQAPQDAVDELKRLVDPPDWFSLLIFVLLRIRDLDPDHLQVGTMRHAEWGATRIVTLTYTQAPASFTVGLALTDPDLTHGLLLKFDGSINTQFGAGPLTVSLNTSGQATWPIAFSGPIAPPPPAVTLKAVVAWNPHIDIGSADTAEFSVGPLHLDATIPATNGRLYELALGLGVGNDFGAHAQVSLKKVLGALGDIVTISPINEAYSPKLVLSQGLPPDFTLGQRSPS